MIDTRGGPSRVERALATAALDAYVRRHADVAFNPLGSKDSVLLAGMKIYRENCAGCHGGADRVPAAFGLGFYPQAPQFVIQPTRRPEGQLFYLVRNGIRRTGMTAWSSIMKDDNIWQVVAFVHRIDSLPASVDSIWRAPSARRAQH